MKPVKTNDYPTPDFRRAKAAEKDTQPNWENSALYCGLCVTCQRWIRHEIVEGHGNRYFYRDNEVAKVVMICAPSRGCQRRVNYRDFRAWTCKACGLMANVGTLCFICGEKDPNAAT